MSISYKHNHTHVEDMPEGCISYLRQNVCLGKTVSPFYRLVYGSASCKVVMPSDSVSCRVSAKTVPSCQEMEQRLTRLKTGDQNSFLC